MTERFEAKVDRSGECHLWTGATLPNGYGVLSLGSSNRNIYVHRFAYEQANGPIPSGKQVQHTCDVRHCVRPEHLKLGTPQDNSDDMKERGRHRNGTLSKSRGRKAPQSIRTPATAWGRLRQMTGLSLRQVEARTGIIRGDISKIERGRLIPTDQESDTLLEHYAQVQSEQSSG